MGVMNLTPDSFSDGGIHLQAQNLKQTLTKWAGYHGLIPDFGAESTAPMNGPVTPELEWKRFEESFAMLTLDQLDHFWALSFDTYRPETMEKILSHKLIKKFRGKKIWNDVSGHFDDMVYKLLEENEDLIYIYSHNAVHSRELTSMHREFSSLFNPENIIQSLQLEFFGVLDELDEEIQKRVWLDPGFGFAKDTSTNLALLENLPELIESFPSHIVWVIGLSRKSFLQDKHQGKVFKEHKDWQALDDDQKIELEKIISHLPEHYFVFRVHNPLPIEDGLLQNKSMSFKIAQLILFSQDTKRLAQFLSDLFDMELLKLSDGIQLSSSHLTLLVVGPTKKAAGPSDLMVDFEVESAEDLENFWQKVQFFKYRYELEDHQEEKITKTDTMSYFVLKDPDGRKWKLSHRFQKAVLRVAIFFE